MSKARAALVGALDAAPTAPVPVRLHRDHHLERLEGYVVGVGDRWVLLARLADGLWLRGWTAVRLAQVARVDPLPDAAFVERTLRVRGHWPPAASPVDVDLSGTGALLSSLQAGEPLVAIYTERATGTRAVGVVRRVGRRTLHLLEVSPEARWRDGTTGLALDDVTRVDIGGGYEAALQAAVGPPPPPQTPGA